MIDKTAFKNSSTKYTNNIGGLVTLAPRGVVVHSHLVITAILIPIIE